MKQRRTKLIAQKAFRYEAHQEGGELGTWIFEVVQGESWNDCVDEAVRAHAHTEKGRV